MMSLTLFALALSIAADEPSTAVVTPTAALAEMRQIVLSDRGHASISIIGKSWTGLPIEVVSLSENVMDADKKPAILLVAGLDGSRPSSVAIAVAAMKKILADQPALQASTFYLIPCANPDAYIDTFMPSDSRANRNARPVDEDRDGLSDEDPPRDLNGDGAITQIRRLNPPASDPATHMLDPADVRLMRMPDATKDQRATYSMYVEGLDSDHDGLIAEDDFGGVDIDRNFPHRWPEFDPAAGRYQLSEPESQALANFVLAHPRIIAAMVIGRWDNLVKTPDAQARDATGKTPLALDSLDKATWEEMGRLWREVSKQTRSQECDPSGSFALWLYAHRGIPTFATQAWGRPDASALPPPPPPPPNADGSAATAPAPAPAAADKPADEEAAAWLAWSDRDQGGRGFLPWTPFEHPTLGHVEIGGFRSGFRSDPPAGEIARLGDSVASFLAELSKRQPKLVMRNITSRMTGAGVFEIEAEIVNEGWLATACAMGRANRQPDPIIVRISPTKDHILSGQRVTIIDGITGAGGRRAFRWIVQSPPTEPITIEATWKPMGTLRATIIGDKVVLPIEVIQ